MQECLLVCVRGVLCVRVSFVELESLTGFPFWGELSPVQELRLGATELRPVSNKEAVRALQVCSPSAHKRVISHSALHGTIGCA